MQQNAVCSPPVIQSCMFKPGSVASHVFQADPRQVSPFTEQLDSSRGGTGAGCDPGLSR